MSNSYFVLVCALENISVSTKEGLKCPQQYEGHRSVNVDFARVTYAFHQCITFEHNESSIQCLCRQDCHHVTAFLDEERDTSGSLLKI